MKIFKTMKKSNNMTPTWAGIVPALLEAYASASPMKREDIRAEFLKMAKAADLYNKLPDPLK